MYFSGRILLISLLISFASEVYCGPTEKTIEDAKFENRSSTSHNGREVATAAPQNVERFSNGAGTLDPQHNSAVYQQEETSSNETLLETNLTKTSEDVDPATARIVYLAQLCLDGTGNKTRTELIKETAGIVTAQQTVDQINLKLGNDSTYNFELDVHDVCDGDGRLLRTIVENLPDCVHNQSCKSRPSGLAHLAGFIGTLSDADPATVEIAVKGTDIPIISTEYGLEQGEFDSTNYFFTKTPEIVEVKLVVELARHLEWSYVSLVYTNDGYGNYMSYYAKRLLKEAGICVGIDKMLDTKLYSETEYYDLIDGIRNNEATGIIYLGPETQGRSEAVKQRIVRQNRDNSDLKFVAIERLTQKGQNESEHRQALVQSLTSNKPGLFQLWQQLQQNPKLQPTEQDIQQVKEDDLARILFSVQRLTGAFSKLQNDGITFASSTILDLLKSDCRKLDRNNDMNYCSPSSSGLLNEFEMSILSPGSTDYTSIAIVEDPQNEIKFFNKTATIALIDESRCISLCGKCSTETKKPLGYIFIPGSDEHVVVGTAEIHGTDDFNSCGSNITLEGYLSMQAFFLGKQAFQNLTKLNYSVLYLDTCSSVSTTNELLDEIISQDVARIKDIWNRNHEIPILRFLLVIGDKQSSVSMLLQERFRVHRIPQIATGSQSQWLDNSNRYPSLLRLTESNSELVTAFLLVCKELGITRVVVIFSDTPDGISTSSLFESRAKDYQICIQETIRLTKNRTSITAIGQRLAKEESFPRAFLLFSESSFTKILAEAIASKDLIWSQTGRILVSRSNLLNLIQPTQIRKFLGSININTETEFLAKPDQASEELTRSHLLDFSHDVATYNMWYVHFWQQLGQCYISNLTTIPNAYTLNYTRRCDLSCGLNYHEKKSCIVNDMSERLDVNNVQVRFNILAWLAFAYSVNTHHPTGSNHTMLYQRLANSQVPSRSFAPGSSNDRSFTVFNVTTRQAQYPHMSAHIMNSIASEQHPIYSEIFKFSVNENSKKLTATARNLPIFYRLGEVDKHFESECSQLLCHCIEGSMESIDDISAPIGSKPPPTGAYSRQKSNFYVLLAFTILFILIVLVLAFILFRLREYLPQLTQKNRSNRQKIRYNSSRLQIEEKLSSTEQERDDYELYNIHRNNLPKLGDSYVNFGDGIYQEPNTQGSHLRSPTGKPPASLPIPDNHNPRSIDTSAMPNQQTIEPREQLNSQPSLHLTPTPNNPGQTCNANGDLLLQVERRSANYYQLQLDVHNNDDRGYEHRMDSDSDEDGDFDSVSVTYPAPQSMHQNGRRQASDPIQPADISHTTNGSPVSVQDNQTRSFDSPNHQEPLTTYEAIQPADISHTTNGSPPVSVQGNQTRSFYSHNHQEPLSIYEGGQNYFASGQGSPSPPVSIAASSGHTLALHSLKED